MQRGGVFADPSLMEELVMKRILSITSIIGMLVFSVPATTWSSGAEPTWRDLFRQASVLQKQGKISEAVPCAKAALEKCRNTEGRDEAKRIKSLVLLGELNRERNRLQEASRYYRKAMIIHENRFGPGHPNNAGLMCSLGEIYLLQGRGTEAEILFKKSREILDQDGRRIGPDMARSLNGLASLCQAQGDLNQAEAFYSEAAHIYSLHTKYGQAAKRKMATILFNLGDVAKTKGEYAKASSAYRDSLACCEKSGDSSGLLALNVMSSLGDTYCRWGKPARSISCYEAALGMVRRDGGQESLAAALIERKLGDLQLERGHISQAEKNYERAITVMERCSPQSCPLLESTRKALTDVRQMLNTRRSASTGDTGLMARVP